MPLAYARTGYLEAPYSLLLPITPSLHLDFVNQQYVLGLREKAFSDIITFSRASGGGRFNENGEYEWLTDDEPRIDYDPITGECLGLLIEAQRTNKSTLFAAPTDLTNTAAGGGGGVLPTFSVVDDAAELAKIGLDGITGGNCYKLDNSSGLDWAWANASGAVGNLNAHRCSVFIRYEGINSGHNVLYAAGVGASGQSNPIENGLGYQRISFQLTPGDPSNFFRIRVGAGGIAYFVCPQTEEGAFETSYIPTAGSAVTRAADTAYLPAAPWANPSQGVVFAEAKMAQAVSEAAEVIINLGISASTTDRISLFQDTTGKGLGFVSTAGAVQANLLSTASPDQKAFRSAIAYEENNIRYSAMGEAVQSDLTAVIPMIERLYIGRRASTGTTAIMHIRTVGAYPTANISDSTLQLMTTPELQIPALYPAVYEE